MPREQNENEGEKTLRMKRKLFMDYKQRRGRIKSTFQKDHSCFGVESGTGGKWECKCENM